MAEPYSQRVSDAFSPPVEPAQVEKFMDLLAASAEQLAKSVRGDLSSALLIMAAFLLLNTAEIATISLGPIEISSTSQVTVFLTTGAAYFYLDMSRTLNDWLRVDAAWKAAMNLWNARVVENNLYLLLVPPMPSYFHWVREWPEGKSAFAYDRLFRTVALYLALVVMFVVPLAFEIWAFWSLFTTRGGGDLLTWINLALSSLCLVIAGAFTVVDAGTLPAQSPAA